MCADVPAVVSTIAVSVGSMAINVSWAAGANNGAPIQAFDVYACMAQYMAGTQTNVPTGACVAERVTGSPPSPQATVSGLTAGFNYSVLVSARNSIGSSGNVSAPASFYTTLARPMKGFAPALVSPALEGLSNKTVIHVQ